MSQKLRVLLVQLPVPNNPSLNTPLAAGYLKSYAYAQGLFDVADIELLPRWLADHAGDALLVDEIAARQPDVLGFSLYTWNSERSLDIIRRVKARLPDLQVIVGGPEVQKDNLWILQHPAIDIAVIGEGEQTFAELLRLGVGGREARGARREAINNPVHLVNPVKKMRWETGIGSREAGSGEQTITVQPLIPDPRSLIPGIAFRDDFGLLHVTPQRVALNDLGVVPSPYLLGYLDDIPADGMLMVEVSRWCPYSCSFCLYGRNMGAKLGNRYFSLAQIVAEIRWGRERGLRQVHFIEANLNLVPLFRPLMQALHDLNADGQLELYAELRGEHLSDEAVNALKLAGLRVAEVGLQTANPTALKASLRRTDLAKWAAGTRRLYAHGVEVLLDVILGLPEDDADGVAETLDFLQRESLAPYDVFTLQVLPGTTVYAQAAERGYRHQDRPPYYVLQSDRLEYAELRRLRRDLKRGAGLEPDAVEGCPEPRYDALVLGDRRPTTDDRPATIDDRPQMSGQQPTAMVNIIDWRPVTAQHQRFPTPDLRPPTLDIHQLANHVDMIGPWSLVSDRWSFISAAITANPSTLFDVYLCDDAPPLPAALRRWRDALPYQPGYLDRVAVYRRAAPEPAHVRVSPRVWLVVPWTAQLAPEAYADVAEIIWAYDLAPGEEPPLGAWHAAGGAGIVVRGATREDVARWRAACGLRLWHA